jgi:Family of unknown function (DUF6356)
MEQGFNLRVCCATLLLKLRAIAIPLQPRIREGWLGWAMDLIGAFREHPASVGETYTEHMGHAACFGVRMMAAGLACLVHALLPFLFVQTGSRTIAELNDRMITGRRTRPQPIAGKQRLIS